MVLNHLLIKHKTQTVLALSLHMLESSLDGLTIFQLATSDLFTSLKCNDWVLRCVNHCGNVYAWKSSINQIKLKFL